MSGVHVSNFVVLGIESGGEIVHHIAENERIYVLAQHAEQEPISKLGSAYNGADGFTLHQSKPNAEQVHSHSRTYNYDQPEIAKNKD